MLTYRDLSTGFKELEIDFHKPIMVHTSLSSFGEIRRGAETLLGALLASFPTVISPTFTYKTMVIPETGPENNGIEYGSGRDLNKMAEFFSRDMPADRLMGTLSEKVRLHPHATRSTHPILSFAGINAQEAIETQTLNQPFAPIQWLAEHQGSVLLLGVDHTVNTSIHLAEQLAGRKMFIRWALSSGSILECPVFPGCSDGFNQVETELATITIPKKIGNALIKAIPICEMIERLVPMIHKEPEAFLCERANCPRCTSVRNALAG